MKKRLTTFLLASLLLVSVASPMIGLPVSATSQGGSQGTSQGVATSNTIVDAAMDNSGNTISVSEVTNKTLKTTSNKYIRVYSQYCARSLPTRDVTLLSGIVPSTEIKMTFLQRLKFKTSYCNTTFGNAVSCKVEMYEGGKTIELKPSSSGYYTYDVSKPVYYKLKVSYKTDKNNTLNKYYTIDNRPFIKRFFLWNTDGEYYYYDNDTSSADVNYSALSNTFRNHIVPEGSKMTYLNSDEFKKNFTAAYIAKYADYRVNGMSAKWVNLKANNILTTGEYAIMFKLKNTKATYRYVVAIPYMYVAKQAKVIDVKDVLKLYKEKGNQMGVTIDDEYDREEQYIWHLRDDIENDFHNYLCYDSGNLRFKSNVNFKNIFSVRDLIYWSNDTENEVNRIKSDGNKPLCNYMDDSVMVANNGITNFNITEFRLYYTLDKNVDCTKANYTLVTDKSLYDITEDRMYEIDKLIDNLDTNDKDYNTRISELYKLQDSIRMGENSYYTVKIRYKVNGTWDTCYIKNVPATGW